MLEVPSKRNSLYSSLLSPPATPAARSFRRQSSIGNQRYSLDSLTLLKNSDSLEIGGDSSPKKTNQGGGSSPRTSTFKPRGSVAPKAGAMKQMMAPSVDTAAFSFLRRSSHSVGKTPATSASVKKSSGLDSPTTPSSPSVSKFRRANVLAAAGTSQTSSLHNKHHKCRIQYEEEKSPSKALYKHLVQKVAKTCHHFDRNCQVKCNKCRMFFPCRFCHDLHSFEQNVLEPQRIEESHQSDEFRDSPFSCNMSDEQDFNDNQSMSNRSSMSARSGRSAQSGRSCQSGRSIGRSFKKIPHEFDQKKVTVIKCNLCLLVQAPARYCKNNNCQVQFGKYYCLECNLYDNEIWKKQYHCGKCGICKMGGRENSFHCDQCQACVPVEARDMHDHSAQLINPCAQCDLPIDSQASASQSITPKCGHQMHRYCYKEMSQMNEKCNKCEASTNANMQSKTNVAKDQKADINYSSKYMIQDHIDNRKEENSSSTLKVVSIDCGECFTRSTNVEIGIVGARCDICFSYNTMVVQPEQKKKKDYTNSIYAAQKQLHKQISIQTEILD